MSARTLHLAERRAANAARHPARAAVAKATTIDTRMISLISPTDPRREEFEKATANARAAEAKTDEARKRVGPPGDQLDLVRTAAHQLPRPLRSALLQRLAAQLDGREFGDS